MKRHTHYVGPSPVVHSHKAPNRGWFEKGYVHPYPDHRHEAENLTTKPKGGAS